MRKQIKHNILKDISLTSVLDDHLTYGNITRDDYQLFINELMKMLTINWVGSTAILPSAKYTTFFGSFRDKENKQVFKFAVIKQNLVEAGLINISQYHFDVKNPELSYPSEINLTTKFQDAYEQKQMAFGLNEVNDKYYKKLYNTKAKPEEDAAGRKHYDLLMSERVSFDIETYSKDMTTTEVIRNWRVVSFFNKDIFTISDDKTGRIYSSFTTLTKAARPHLMIDGKHLESIDLKSAQPLLFVYYLKNIGVKSEELDAFENIIIEDDVYYWFLNKYISMFGSNEYTEFDKKSFKYIKKNIEGREDAKVQMFRFLYKSNRGEKPPFEKVFQVEFPNLYEEVKNIKRSLQKLNTNLAVKMQKLEADIFIPVANQYSEEGCLSLHDALYFVPEIKDKVLKTLKEQFETFNIKHYTLT